MASLPQNPQRRCFSVKEKAGGGEEIFPCRNVNNSEGRKKCQVCALCDNDIVRHLGSGALGLAEFQEKN